MRKPVLRFFLLPCLATACQAEPVVLTEVAQIRALSREEAAKARAVKLRGGVTWRDSDSRPSFFVYDGQWNIWVDRSTATARGIRRGGEIDGTTGTGGHPACIGQHAFLRIGL